MNIDNIISIVPDKSSGTASWITYYEQLEKRYGKSNAQAAFAFTWEKRGGSSKVDINEIRKTTGINFDRSVWDSYKGSINEAFSFGTSVQKYIIITGAVIGTLLVIGIVYRVVTASAQEVGTVAGTAAKAMV